MMSRNYLLMAIAVGLHLLPGMRAISGTPAHGVDLLCLTEFGDVWASVNEEGIFQPPVRMGHLGFHNSFATSRQTVAADFTGDGLLDMGTVTDYGDLWIAVNRGDLTFEAPTRISSGWKAGNDFSGKPGSYVLAGDLNGDGLADLIQFDVHPWVIALNEGGLINSPTGTLRNPYGFADRRLEGLVDVDGDGDEEILIRDPNPTGPLGYIIYFVYDLVNESLAGKGQAYIGEDFRPPQIVHWLDYTGDGLVDCAWLRESKVIFRNNMNDGFVHFGQPTSSPAAMGFQDDATRGEGWWVLTGDVDGGGTDDLIQINEYGEAWVALSSGEGFDPAVKNAALGFHHRPNGPWQIWAGRVR